MDPPAFERQLKWLRRFGYDIISLSALTDYLDKGTHPNTRAVALRFDDGHLDNLTNAMPIMQKYGAGGTVFVVAGKIGQTLEFDYEAPDGNPVMTADQIREAVAGGIDIQSHGMTHANLAQLTDAEVFAEMKESKEILEEIIRKPVDLFCYPFGACRPEFQALCRKAGYRAAFSTYNGNHHSERERFFLKRLSIHYHRERKLWKFFDHLLIKSYARSQKKLDVFLDEVTRLEQL